MKTITFENFSVEVAGTYKNFVKYYSSKSLPNFKGMSKQPKIGVIAADLKKDGTVELHQRIGKSAEAKNGWKLINSFKPSRAGYGAAQNRVVYFTQKHLHIDILLKKDLITITENGQSITCNGKEAVDRLFNPANYSGNVEIIELTNNNESTNCPF